MIRDAAIREMEKKQQSKKNKIINAVNYNFS